MPLGSKPGGGLKTKNYAMQMGAHSGSCDTTFKKKDKDLVEKASGKKPLLPGLKG